jgi:hypothetical protein
VSGDDDPLIPLANARLMRLLIPNSRLHIYHGGHLGLVTEAAELAPVVDAFLAAPTPPWPAIRPVPGQRSRAASEEEFMTGCRHRRDFYLLELLLDPEGRQLLHRVREFMEKSVQPVINHYWTREEFPHDLMGDFGQLGIAGQPTRATAARRRQPARRHDRDGAGPGRPVHRHVHRRARRPGHGVDLPVRVEEQKQRWLPEMARMEKIGAFGLTEPDVGSGVAGGLTTTARRDGDEWVLDGQKKWIGNATFADYVIIWARSLEDDQVKGFVVEKGHPGFETTKMKRQDRAAGGAERAHHAGRASGCPRPTGCRRRTRSRTPPRCCG